MRVGWSRLGAVSWKSNWRTYDRSLVALENEIESRDRTSIVAARLSVRLEEIESEIVGERLEKMGPLLRRVYSRMDPHPSFRDVSLVARTYYRKGRLTATVSDALEDVSSEAPHLVLSSAQVNVLALAIFLTLNLSVGLRLRAALLDDPLQSLDDVNLLGLSDLLRRTKGTRQVLVSTHDERLGSLLARKLRPVGSDDRTLVITFGVWTRSGPEVSSAEVDREDPGLRVVA